MTKKQIILCLLPIYKNGIRHIQKLKSDEIDLAINILTLFGLSYGVCHACDRLLREDVYTKKWIKRNSRYKGSHLWARFPYGLETTEEMVASLQIRVDIMEKELKRRWWHVFK